VWISWIPSQIPSLWSAADGGRWMNAIELLFFDSNVRPSGYKPSIIEVSRAFEARPFGLLDWVPRPHTAILPFRGSVDTRYELANDGHDTRAIQAYLGTAIFRIPRALYRAGSAEFQGVLLRLAQLQRLRRTLLVHFCSQPSRSSTSPPMYRRIDFLDSRPSFVVRFKQIFA
jgi:hypothetical protein